MTISTGDTLPEATFVEMGENGPQEVSGGDIIGNGKVVIFGLPGAYTGVCSTAHVPSFIRTADAFRAKGVDRIVCVTVNDPFVLEAWSKSTGAGDAGIQMLGDADASFTKAIGMDFTAPPVGLINRSKRYAMLVENGVVSVLNLESSPGECEISAGETLLDTV
jgi:peroxiredoxin